MAINQIDFKNTIKKFSKVEDARGILWYKSRNLLLKGYEIEAYILILATWDIAYFKFVLKNFNLIEFEDTIKKINPIFNKIKKKTFECADFKNNDLRKDIKMIYSNLKKFVKQTGATKIMALKNPDLFVMWDTEIRKMYKIDNQASPDDYIEFLEKMKNEFREIKWQDKKRPFAKVIDEYNYVKAQENRKRNNKMRSRSKIKK
jgi:hypothetical protein